MEVNYQILKDGQENRYVVVHKEHPGFLVNVSFVNNKLQVIKITLMEVCDLSVLTDSLIEIEQYFKEETINSLPEARGK